MDLAARFKQKAAEDKTAQNDLARQRLETKVVKRLFTGYDAWDAVTSEIRKGIYNHDSPLWAMHLELDLPPMYLMKRATIECKHLVDNDLKDTALFKFFLNKIEEHQEKFLVFFNLYHTDRCFVIGMFDRTKFTLGYPHIYMPTNNKIDDIYIISLETLIEEDHLGL